MRFCRIVVAVLALVVAGSLFAGHSAIARADGPAGLVGAPLVGAPSVDVGPSRVAGVANQVVTDSAAPEPPQPSAPEPSVPDVVETSSAVATNSVSQAATAAPSLAPREPPELNEPPAKDLKQAVASEIGPKTSVPKTPPQETAPQAVAAPQQATVQKTAPRDAAPQEATPQKAPQGQLEEPLAVVAQAVAPVAQIVSDTMPRVQDLPVIGESGAAVVESAGDVVNTLVETIKPEPQAVVDQLEQASGLEVPGDSITEVIANIDEGQETVLSLAADTVAWASEPPPSNVVPELPVHIDIDQSNPILDAEITGQRTPFLPVPNVYESGTAPGNPDPGLIYQPVPETDTPKPEPDEPTVVVAALVVAVPVIDEPDGNPEPVIVVPVPHPADPGTAEEPDATTPVFGPVPDDEIEAEPSGSAEHRRSPDQADAATAVSLSVLTSGGMNSPAASIPLLLALSALLWRRVDARSTGPPDDVFGTVPVPPG